MALTTEMWYEGINGDRFTLAGPQAGDRHLHFATDPSGFYEPPSETTYEVPASMPGSRYLSHRYLSRENVWGVEALHDGGGTLIQRTSDWRKAWSLSEDGKFYVSTQESGTRWLDMRLKAEPALPLNVDPDRRNVHRLVMTTICENPMYHSKPLTRQWVCPVDTSGRDGTQEGDFEEYEIVVKNANPTSQPVWPKWWVSAPGIWVIPDYGLEDPLTVNRRIVMPELTAGENITIDSDPYERQVMSENGIPTWQRMGMVRFVNAIPPYTKTVRFKVGVTGAPAGATVRLELERSWLYPWGDV